MKGVITILTSLLSLGITGCFTTRLISMEKLKTSSEPQIVRIVPLGGKALRGIVAPGDISLEAIRYQPLRYGPSSWTVRFGGWPMIYTAGRHRRHEVWGEPLEIPLQEVRKLYREKFSWGLTLISSPLTMPVGLIDFVAHHAQFGFEKSDSLSYTSGIYIAPDPSPTRTP